MSFKKVHTKLGRKWPKMGDFGQKNIEIHQSRPKFGVIHIGQKFDNFVIRIGKFQIENRCLCRPSSSKLVPLPANAFPEGAFLAVLPVQIQFLAQSKTFGAKFMPKFGQISRKNGGKERNGQYSHENGK